MWECMAGAGKGPAKHVAGRMRGVCGRIPEMVRFQLQDPAPAAAAGC